MKINILSKTEFCHTKCWFDEMLEWNTRALSLVSQSVHNLIINFLCHRMLSLCGKVKKKYQDWRHYIVIIKPIFMKFSYNQSDLIFNTKFYHKSTHSNLHISRISETQKDRKTNLFYVILKLSMYLRLDAFILSW